MIQRFVSNLNIFEASLGKNPDKRDQAGFQARSSLEDGIHELFKVYRILKRQEFRNV